MSQGRAIRVLASREQAVQESVRYRNDFTALLAVRGHRPLPEDVQSQWWPLAHEHQQEETQR